MNKLPFASQARAWALAAKNFFYKTKTDVNRALTNAWQAFVTLPAVVRTIAYLRPMPAKVVEYLRPMPAKVVEYLRPIPAKVVEYLRPIPAKVVRLAGTSYAKVKEVLGRLRSSPKGSELPAKTVGKRGMVLRFVAVNLVVLMVTSPFVVIYGPFTNIKRSVVGAIMTSRHPQYITWLLSETELKKHSRRLNRRHSAKAADSPVYQAK